MHQIGHQKQDEEEVEEKEKEVAKEEKAETLRRRGRR